MKKLAWVAILLGVVAGLVLVIGGRKKDEPKYRTAKVDRGAVTQTVTATGFLSAVTTVEVGSQVSGIIAALHADFNSKVKKGDLLATLDPTPFEARVAQNQANLDKAQVELRNADIALRRQKKLVDEGLSPQADYDAVKGNFDAARASVSQAAASLKQSRTDLGYTRIVAPIDGVVVDRQYDVGQTVAASFQAPTLFTIAQDLTKMQVAADVSESDIGKVRAGQPARFTVDAFPEREFRGSIAQIRLNATVNQNVVTYPVIIGVANPDGILRPNMTANISIDVARVREAVRIPNAALRFRPEASQAGSTAEERAARTGSQGGTRAMAGQFEGAAGGGRRAARSRGQTVYKLAPGQKEPVEVQIRTGISDGRVTQVVSGDLKEGDAVVVGLATARADVPAGSAPGMGGGRGAGGGGRRGF